VGHTIPGIPGSNDSRNRWVRGIRNIHPSELQRIFHALGSNLNPTLTQIAKCKRVLFVEGKDFTILSRLARKLGLESVANRTDFAVVPVEGFNPARLKAFKLGIEKTIGSSVLAAVIFDRDYRSKNEIKAETADLLKGNYFAHIHEAKEIENFLIIPNAIKNAVEDKLVESNVRTGTVVAFNEKIEELLSKISSDFKNKTQAQLHAHRLKFEKQFNPALDSSTLIEDTLREFDEHWSDLKKRFKLVPGKEFLSHLNQYLQDKYGVSISYTNIINKIDLKDFPSEMKVLLNDIDKFRKERIEKQET
jgi:hypothetical protein